MKNLKTVIGFSIKEMVTKKSFIISTVIIIALIVIAFNIPNALKSFSDEDTSLGRILIIDEDDVYEGNLKSLETVESDYEFKIADKKYKYEDIKDQIEYGRISSCIIITKNKDKINLEYIVESLNTFAGTAEIPEKVLETLANVYTNMQIMKLNLSDEELKSITPQFEFSLKETNENSASGEIFLVMLLSLVLFYAIFFCASKVSTSVTTEKTSKIMETLVTSTDPKTIVIGKTIGIGLVGLFQLLVMIITGVISAKLFIDKEVLASLIDLSNVNIGLGLITILYFLLGYFLFAFIFALTGSAVGSPEDTQSANMPASILGVIGFYIAYFAMMNPASEVNIFATYFPISAPFSLPFRMLLGTATRNQIISSVAIMVITIAIIAKISIKVYSSAILNYGTKLSFKDLIKLAKRKEE